MKKIILILLGMAMLANPLHAKGLTTVKGADNVTVKVSLVTDPPVVGKNNIKVELTDAKGNALTDAKVKVYYSMTPMKGMMPMNYKAKAKLEGDSYITTLDIGMKGSWDVKFKIKRENADSLNVKASFKVK